MPRRAVRALPGQWRQHFGDRPPMDSLLDVFRRAPDPRGRNTRCRIGPVLTLIALAQHEDGAPHALAVYDQKENTPRCEPTTAAALLAQLPALDGQPITADPLHCQRGHARAIVEKGGDDPFQIKGNQPKLLAQAQKLNALKDTLFAGAKAATVG